jgi:outer membrane protein
MNQEQPMNKKMSLRQGLMAALCVVACTASSVAQAQSAGTILGRIGVTSIMPQVQSGDLSKPSPPGTRIDVSTATGVGGGVTYMVNDHWSVDVPLGLPYESKIKGDGAISGSGEIGKAKVLPITVFGQYRFMEASARARPYVGLGLTYANFMGEQGNGTLTGLLNPGGTPVTLKIEDKWTLTPQVGVTTFVTPTVFVEAMVAKSWLKTRSTLSTGQTIDVKLDPVTIGLYVGYKY